MGLSAPLGLLALLAVPAVVALHMFRRRLRERRVAGLFLFAEDRLAADSGRRRAPLRSTASLWLEIAAALLLSLLVAGLTFGADRRLPHLVLVLDDSASMGAIAEGRSAADRARDFARERLAALPGGSAATVILTGLRPEVVAGPRAPLPIAREAVARWTPESPTHDFAPALHLGRELAAEGGRLLFLTDRGLATCPPAAELQAFGRAAGNAAILSARRAEGRIHLSVAAWGGLPVETTLRLSGGEGAVAESRLSVEPGKPVHLSLPDPLPGRALRAEIGADALPIDNAVLLLPEPSRVVGVCADLPAETAALLRFREVAAAMRDVAVVPDRGGAHLVVTGAAGAMRPGCIEVVLEPIAPGAERDDWIGPYLLERRHPLLDGVTLEGVVWGAGRSALPGLPLLLAGEAALLSEEEEETGVRYRLNLDPARTNLPSSPDWPILFSNLCALARQRMPGPEEVNVRLGETLRYRPGGGERVADLELHAPDGSVERARGFRVATFAAARPGEYRLTEGEREVARFAVCFVDGSESDLTGAEERSVAATEEGAAAGVDGREGIEAQLLALLLLLVLATDWYLLGRGA